MGEHKICVFFVVEFFCEFAVTPGPWATDLLNIRNYDKLNHKKYKSWLAHGLESCALS